MRNRSAPYDESSSYEECSGISTVTSTSRVAERRTVQIPSCSDVEEKVNSGLRRHEVREVAEAADFTSFLYLG